MGSIIEVWIAGGMNGRRYFAKSGSPPVSIESQNSRKMAHKPGIMDFRVGSSSARESPKITISTWIDSTCDISKYYEMQILPSK
uniref:Uncharacterized protein n=1 Tax=Vespula pensylvanica TaxID=30213 RepID=A0A834N0H5_VESPE|nr:hypothetical protein H0235_018157 [Vespula pensylvanica]